jgi:hypothetical protein
MDKELTWSVVEYRQKDHTVDWYWTVGLVMLVVIIACIYFKNYLLAFLLFIGVGALLYMTIRKPDVVDVTISNAGVTLRQELFPYRKLKAFWIEEEPQHTGDRHLLIMTSRVYAPLMAVPLGDIAPEMIRQALISHIPEQEMHENVSHHFLEMLGF